MVYVHLDVSEIIGLSDMKEKVEESAKAALRDLSGQAYAHIVENVQSKLHSTRNIYLDNLKPPQQIEDDVWLIELGEKALFIEEGIEPNKEMIDDLLKSKSAKTAKDGCVLNPRNKVLTSTGWKKIKDIIPGDMVLTHSGKFREVKQLLVRPAGLGTRYVNFQIISMNVSGRPILGDLKAPSISLTEDHLVLTPKGWVEAGTLKNGDLIATPADLKNLCKNCNLPLPINAISAKFCLNNRCARQWGHKEGRLLNIPKKQRILNSKIANNIAKLKGVFNNPNWGARNPDTLLKLRKASVEAQKRLISNGRWAPEEFFAQELVKLGMVEGQDFIREFPIKTDRIVKNGNGGVRNSTLFIDFFFPKINYAIELDGKYWHSQVEAQERDKAKNDYCAKNNLKLHRFESHKIYKIGPRIARFLNLWHKNHSGELGVAWVRVRRLKTGVVNRKDHVYANKYDICLDAEEHSFCCETVFIHNSRYAVIPFQHNKKSQNMTPAQKSLLDTIKSEFKNRKIPYGKLETDPSGKPKTGLLHSFDIKHAPIKTSNLPGQGKGRVGEVMQGPTGIPLLSGLRVYQKEVKTPDGKSKVHKAIITFRVVSSKDKGSGKWCHPGLVPKKFLDEAAAWALREFETKIQKQLIAEVTKSI